MDPVEVSVQDYAKLMAAGEQYQRDVAEAFKDYIDDPEGWGEWCQQMDAWRDASN
jgi:hypothetical protein